MRDQIKRRVGALVLALSLALSLAAPVWAADPEGTDDPADPGESPSAAITGITFGSTNPIIRANSDPKTWNLQASLLPSGSVLPEGEEITWDVTVEKGDPKTKPKITGTGLMATITSGGPGVFTITAEYKGFKASKEVTISGITLTQTNLEMLVGGSKIIAVDEMYGFAASGSPVDVEWSSDDPSIVTVMNGELIAWQLGTTTIVATKNGYTAECKVTVKEDEDVIAGPYGASTGKPLILSTAYDDLNRISYKRTQVEDENGELSGGSPLNYITNVTVPTSQGTLYYNYNSEANTGEGVGSADRFSQYPSGTIRSLDMLYFVPRQGFSGTAEITFNGWSVSGVNFTGTIKVDVTGADRISYRTQAGEPAFFLTGDFNAYCRSQTGRDVNYVTFNLPQASQGVLYYNYIAGSGDRVSTATQYSQSGRYTIDDVCFVPNAAFVGEATISYRGVDTAGKAFNGEVVVTVSPSSSAGDSTNVFVSGERGKPVVFQSSLFNAACQETIHDTLSYVSFKLPTLDEGTLYYNYRGEGNFDSRVKATTRYFYSGVPSINNVTFVPASGARGRIAITYTGYGSAGTTFTGTLYISLGDEDRSVISYSVPKNGAISFNTGDFNTAGLYLMGVGVDYVEFQVPDTDLGSLYYDYRGEDDAYWVDFSAYYLNPKESWDRRLDLISFHAKSMSGTVIIPYTAYSSASGADNTRESFAGSVVIQVGASMPADIIASCNTSGQVWLSSNDLSGVCRPVMSKNLSHIEITSVPGQEEGHLYLNYAGFGTGTAVKQGDRFYCIGSPNIDQLSFVPRAGFTGKIEITYIGSSSDGQEQVSGRIEVNVTRSEVSQFFNDLGGHVWAIDSVDYLWQNGTVEGVGGGRYNPSGTITKGDFTLMLVRAYGLTASGNISFKDVPSGSYYANAIRIAALLGIGSSSNGNYYPNIALSRQDAMVMIYNALKASGRTLTNGLAADLSIYHDEGQIAPYARTAMGSLVQMGVVKGDGNGYLRPQSLLSRAETAMLLHTIMTL